MTKLVFRYSPIYDKSIYSWLGKHWKSEYTQEGLKYVKEIQRRWNKLNHKVFITLESFGFKLPEIWQAYVVTCKKITDFSDPLTIKISYEWNRVFAALIHELAHVEFSYSGNKNFKNKTFNYVKKTFSKENPQTRAHLSVNLLQLCVMAKVFPKKYQKMLAQQKSLPGLKRAWEIIEKNKENIDLSDPVKSILRLRICDSGT